MDAARVKTDVRRYIVSTWLNGDERGFEDDTDMQQTGILDSFSTLSLTAFLDETFELRLDPADINSETFRSINTLTELVLAKVAEKGMGSKST